MVFHLSFLFSKQWWDGFKLSPWKGLNLLKELIINHSFSLMTFKEFRVQSLNMWSRHSLVKLYKAVSEDFCSKETALQSGIKKTGEGWEKCQSRWRGWWCSKDNCMCLGARNLWHWWHLEFCLQMRPGNLGAKQRILIYNFILMCHCFCTFTCHHIWRHQTAERAWLKCRKRCSVVVLNGNIYVICEHCDPEYLSNVE